MSEEIKEIQIFESNRRELIIFLLILCAPTVTILFCIPISRLHIIEIVLMISLSIVFTAAILVIIGVPYQNIQISISKNKIEYKFSDYKKAKEIYWKDIDKIELEKHRDAFVFNPIGVKYRLKFFGSNFSEYLNLYLLNKRNVNKTLKAIKYLAEFHQKAFLEIRKK